MHFAGYLFKILFKMIFFMIKLCRYSIPDENVKDMLPIILLLINPRSMKVVSNGNAYTAYGKYA